MPTENEVHIQSFVRGACVVITIMEERMRDFARMEQIKEQVLSSVQESLARYVIVDLHQVRFVGSVAFLVFLAIRRIPLVERVILCNLDENVKEMFSLCRLIPSPGRPNAPFEVTDTVQAAIELCE